jgi:hypothetical protein
LNGQWLGKFTGSNNGYAIINIDDRGDHYEGVAYMHSDNTALPSTYAYFRTTDKSESSKLNKVPVYPINPTTKTVDSWENVKKYYGDNIVFSKHVDVEGNWNQESLKLNWKTDLGFEGYCELPKSSVDKPSEYIPKRIDGWNNYKKHVADMEPRKFIFRGQNGQRRLRTRFHRTGRANVNRFVNDDIPTLYRHLSARTHHIFNLKDPEENGAFYNLVQHHGYPTPLLDWTYSPYVAAFFAYRDITNLQALKAADNEKVRIFVFDKQQWENDFVKSFVLATSFLHLSVMDFVAINNERMIPQQAVSTVTNIDDIEAYIKSRETEHKKYLNIIDLPVKDRKEVMRELSYMGITAGSLFPGLDGACEELKERFFEV